jgi:hypothetical protein
MAESEYFSDLKINMFRLDEEFEHQPVLYMKYAEKAAAAAKKSLELEKRRKMIQAELYKKYRKQFTDNAVKFTDTMLDAYVRDDEEYKTITFDWIDAVETANIYADVKWAFQQRKSSLEEIQKGILAGLYSAPAEGERKQHRETQQAVTKSLGEKRRRV